MTPKRLQCAEISLQSTPHENRHRTNDDKPSTQSPSEKDLVKLHTRLIRVKHRYGRAIAQRHEALCFAAWLEDVSNNTGSRLRSFRRGPMPVGAEEEAEGEEEVGASRFGAFVRSQIRESDWLPSIEW